MAPPEFPVTYDPSAMHDIPSIVRVILGGYTLPVRGFHGVVHWARVLENAKRIAGVTGADPEVVELFAVFHDSRRINEHVDPGHGRRGAELARTLRGSLVHLEDARFDLLFEACRLHTDGGISSDPTIQACWDADRLDLGRVGIVPEPERLCCDAARDLLDWAHDRAVRDHEPADVLASWGLAGVIPVVTAGEPPVIPLGLDRFLVAQRDTYQRALAELRAGQKQSHWVWFIFPQLSGLGTSPASVHYGIHGEKEAAAYLRHPVLGARLRECASAVLAVEGKSAHEILGFPDELKLRSSATLFARVAEPGSVFEQILQRYYDGVPDAQTLTLLDATKE